MLSQTQSTRNATGKCARTHTYTKINHCHDRTLCLPHHTHTDTHLVQGISKADQVWTCFFYYALMNGMTCNQKHPNACVSGLEDSFKKKKIIYTIFFFSQENGIQFTLQLWCEASHYRSRSDAQWEDILDVEHWICVLKKKRKKNNNNNLTS